MGDRIYIGGVEPPWLSVSQNGCYLRDASTQDLASAGYAPAQKEEPHAFRCGGDCGCEGCNEYSLTLSKTHEALGSRTGERVQDVAARVVSERDAATARAEQAERDLATARDTNLALLGANVQNSEKLSAARKRLEALDEQRAAAELTASHRSDLLRTNEKIVQQAKILVAASREKLDIIAGGPSLIRAVDDAALPPPAQGQGDTVLCKACKHFSHAIDVERCEKGWVIRTGPHACSDYELRGAKPLPAAEGAARSCEVCRFGGDVAIKAGQCNGCFDVEGLPKFQPKPAPETCDLSADEQARIFHESVAELCRSKPAPAMRCGKLDHEGRRCIRQAGHAGSHDDNVGDPAPAASKWPATPSKPVHVERGFDKPAPAAEPAKEVCRYCRNASYGGNEKPCEQGCEPNPPAAREGEDFLDVVFDGPPGPVCGRFVEVEAPDGRSVCAGEWIDRKNGLWALRIPRTTALPPAVQRVVKMAEALQQRMDDHSVSCGCDDCNHCRSSFVNTVRSLPTAAATRSVFRWSAFDPRDPEQWPRVLHDENPLGDRVPVTVTWAAPGKAGGK